MQQSLVKYDRQRKLGMMVGRLAMVIAKRKGDPDYAKYEKARRRYIALKKKMIQRNRAAATTVARKLLSQQTSGGPGNPGNPGSK